MLSPMSAANASPIAFGATEGKIFTVTNLTFAGASTSAITGTAGLTQGGPSTGVLLISRAFNALSGGITIDAGTLRTGASNIIADANNITVAAGATLDMATNNTSDTITALTLSSGSSGASVATGTGTLTLGGNVTLNANGSGATGATISGNLALGAATRTFTVADGSALVDLAVSAVISGSGAPAVIKAGAGALTLSGTNTFTTG